MKQFELILALSQAGYLAGQWSSPKDLRYDAMSVDFIRQALSEWVRSLHPSLVVMRDIGGGKSERFVRWEEESGDCDNIAWDFVAYLNRCMWVDSINTGTKRGNAACGLMFFFVQPGNATTGHAIVWWADHNGAIHHVDPGSKQIDHLTPEQLGTIFGGEYA